MSLLADYIRALDEAESWRLVAACRGHAHPEWWHPVSRSEITPAYAICQSCPVRRECLAFGLRQERQNGIWGGTNEEQRYTMLRGRRG